MTYDRYAMNNFKKNGQFMEAVAYAAEPANREQFNEWDYTFLGQILYKLKDYEGYLQAYNDLKAKYPDSTKLDNNMGWSLYHVALKNFDFQNGDKRYFFSNVNKILNNCDSSQFSPRNFIAMYVAKAIFGGKLSVNVNYEQGLKYLEMINAANLNKEEQTREVEGKTIRVASDLEWFHSHKAKALFKLEMAQECINAVEKALASVPKFHNNGDNWLKYYEAKSYLALGNLEKAEAIAAVLLQKMTHWCFYELLFLVAEQKGEMEKALHYGALCSNVDGEHKARVGFYPRYAELLNTMGYNREAGMLLRLVELLYLENWDKEKDLGASFTYDGEIAAMDMRQLFRELRNFWKQEAEKGIEFFEGTITKVLPNGKSGFVQDAAGKSYYFNSKDFTHPVRELREGCRVRFALEERLDKSKGEMKLNAVKLSALR